MRLAGFFFTALITGTSPAQDAQQASRPGWPCVAGRAVDPHYLELSESTGGQIFMFQKGDLARAGPAVSASFTHPATILRAVGNLNGERDFDFPVDSSVESLLVVASVQCRNRILVSRPSGEELTDRNSALSVDLSAGKILRVDGPEPGKWRIRLTGTGLFVLSAHAKTGIALTKVGFSAEGASAGGEASVTWRRDPTPGAAQALDLRLSGQVSRLGVQLVDATGGRISALEPPEPIAEGVYRTKVASRAEHYRVLVTGVDGSAWPFQRMYPVLFRARQ